MSVPGRSEIQGLWLGSSGQASGVNETTPFQPGQLGKVTSVKGAAAGTPAILQYVRRYTTDSATAAAGSIAFWQDVNDYVVSAEGTDAVGGASLPLVAGVFLGANPTTENYGFIQVAGEAEAVVTGTIAAGNLLVCDAQVLRVITTNADGDLHAVAVLQDAVTTAIGTANTVLLNVIRNGW